MPSKNEKILQMSKKFEKIKKEMAAMKKRNSEMQKNLAKMIKALEGLENDNGQLKGEKRKKLNRHQVCFGKTKF
jgi:septation ring formation regulator EzrA